MPNQLWADIGHNFEGHCGYNRGAHRGDHVGDQSNGSNVERSKGSNRRGSRHRWSKRRWAKQRSRRRWASTLRWTGMAAPVGQAATVGVADPFKPDAKGMIKCRGCDAMCKDIRKHLTKTRNSMKCESKYSRAELS